MQVPGELIRKGRRDFDLYDLVGLQGSRGSAPDLGINYLVVPSSFTFALRDSGLGRTRTAVGPCRTAR